MHAQCDRQKVIAEYKDLYLTSTVTFDELDWSGNTENCSAGKISDIAMDKTLVRINYFRSFAGLNTEVYFDSSLNSKSQEAALMMKANNDLDHNPPETWSCYSEDGALAAKRSNLAIGTHSANAISLYIRDPGSNNEAVGHRRWILFSRAYKFGMGSTNNTHALWVIAEKQDNPDVDYIAYPPPGYCPKPLVYPRWSFSKPGADFSHVEITMYDEYGLPVPVSVLEEKRGFGDNTIVWEPEYMIDHIYDEFDHKYSVDIEQVIHRGDTMNYSYDVVFMDPQEDQPNCPDGMLWEGNSCGCTPISTNVLTASETNIRVFPNPFEQIVSIEGMDKNSSISIYNVDGKLLNQIYSVSNELRLNTNDWIPGIYIFQIRSGQKVVTQRLLKG